MYRLDTAEKRIAYRHIPKGAMAINHPDGLGVCYVAPLDGARWQVVAYRGTAGHSEFNYSYKTRELAEKKVEEFFTSLLARKLQVLEYRKSANAPHTLKVGDIITNSWGYDQTNVDWYRITRATDHFVWLQPICGACEQTGFMSGQSTPFVATDGEPSGWGYKDKKEPEQKHKASGNYVTMKYGSGSKWDGRTMYESWYA